jgi:hypothetical protein
MIVLKAGRSLHIEQDWRSLSVAASGSLPAEQPSEALENRASVTF